MRSFVGNRKINTLLFVWSVVGQLFLFWKKKIVWSWNIQFIAKMNSTEHAPYFCRVFLCVRTASTTRHFRTCANSLGVTSVHTPHANTPWVNTGCVSVWSVNQAFWCWTRPQGQSGGWPATSQCMSLFPMKILLSEIISDWNLSIICCGF